MAKGSSRRSSSSSRGNKKKSSAIKWVAIGSVVVVGAAAALYLTAGGAGGASSLKTPVATEPVFGKTLQLTINKAYLAVGEPITMIARFKDPRSVTPSGFNIQFIDVNNADAVLGANTTNADGDAIVTMPLPAGGYKIAARQASASSPITTASLTVLVQ